MIAEAIDIARETYLAILMDRESGGPVIVASPAGGVDIEEVASKTPELIYKVRLIYSLIIFYQTGLHQELLKFL